ncbi:MAG TPA: SAM-dependent methyltransferase, partial [Cupriavidus sp.]|nr:SAM-dependent methyltransferase [Cupriavidus sp.]
MSTAVAQDTINRKAWRSWGARRWFKILSDWTDPGEAAAIAFVADAVRDTPILDVGVGGGRTVPMLRKLSQHYEAIDYMPEMVEICQHNHPDIRVSQMDARDLSAFEDNTFGLVVFS